MKIGSGWPLSIFLSLSFLSLTPLVFFPHHISPYQYPKLLYLSLFLFLSLLFWAFDCLLAGGRRFAGDPLNLLLLGFILWGLLRYPWLSDPQAYLKNPYLWGNLGLAYFLVKQYVRNEKQADILVHLMSLAGVAICLYGLLQVWGIDLSLYQSERSVFGPVRPEGKWGRPFSSLGNPNFLGEFLAALLPLMLALYLSSSKKPLTLLWGASSLASVLLMVLSGARGGLVAGGGGLLLFFFWEKGKGHWRRIILLLLAAFILISGAFFLQGARTGFVRTWQKVAMMSSFSEGSIGSRLLWWRVSGEIIKSHPLMGVGTGEFRQVYPNFQKKFFQGPDSSSWIPAVALTWKDNYNATLEAPHNEYLQITTEMGLPGLLLFSSFFLLLLVESARRRSASRPCWESGCTAGCLAILLACLFGFPLHLPSTGVLFFLMAGLLDYRRGQRADRPEEGRKGDPLFGTLLVLVSCLALLQFIHQARVFQSGRQLYRAIGYQLSGQADQALASFSEAKRLNPKDTEIDYWLGLAHLSAGRLHPAQDSLERTKSLFNSPRLYLTLGAIYSDLKEPGAAEAIYREGIATYPGLAPLHARLGALHAQWRRYGEAIRELEKARQLDPILAETYHFLGHIFYRTGRPQEAYQNLGRFLQLAPSTDPRRPLDLDLVKKLQPGSKSP